MRKHVIASLVWGGFIMTVFAYGVDGYSNGDVARLAVCMFIAGLLTGLMWGYTIFLLFTREHASVFEIDDGGWK